MTVVIRGRRCLACTHPQAQMLDAALAAGQSQGSVARAFGLHKDIVGRHVRKGHVLIPGRAGKIIQRPAPDAGSADAERLIRDIVASLHDIDVSALSTAAQMALFRERRLAAEALAKVAAPLLGGAVKVEDVEGLADFIAVVATELEPYPEARLRILEESRRRGVLGLGEHHAGVAGRGDDA